MANTAMVNIKLVSSADTGYYYVTKKNSRTKTEKIVKKKYDPVERKHVEFRESKIKLSRQRDVDEIHRGAPTAPRFVYAALNKVAGRKWCYEEATPTTPEPAEPHGTQEMRRT